MAIGVAVLVVVLAAGAYFFVGRGKAPATPEKTALALSFTNGQSSQYRFTMSVTGQATAKGIGSSINDQLTGMSTWHVDSIAGNGVARITIKADPVTELNNGRRFDQLAQTFTLRAAPDGHVLAQVGFGTTSGQNDSGPGMPGTDQILPLLPAGPVAVGDQWTSSFDQTNPMGTGVIHYQTSSKLLRFEDVGGVKTAVIWTTADLPIDVSLSTRKALAATGQPATGVRKGLDPTYSLNGRMSFSQTAWLAVEERSLVKSATSGSFVFTLRLTHIDPADQPPGGKLQVKGTVKIEFDRA